jgi:predicted dehydrogenase
MHTVRIGVIGTGYLGSVHAKLYAQIPHCTLAAVCDIEPNRLRALSAQLGVSGYSDYREFFGKVDAVSIAVPTNLHYPIASDCMAHGLHVLIEKPFTRTVREADHLISLASSRALTLQVGHVERFNSAFTATHALIKEPQFIECHRLSPFPHRSLDVGVVLDVMIHDIDIVLGLVGCAVKKTEAIGINVLTRLEDIANARITFTNGCVANLTASRVSDETVRKIRIFQEDTYISLDYKDARASVYRKQGAHISKHDLPIEKEQPLQKELESFVHCVRHRAKPLVSGKAAKDALSLALNIQKQIWQKKKKS